MQLEMSISSNADSPDITLQVLVNNSSALITTCTQHSQIFKHTISDEPAEHCVTLVVSGKNGYHTKVDEFGNIISDVTIKIDNIILDEIDVTDIFCSGKLCYQHTANGTRADFVDNFYGIIGCNGKVLIEFTTPIHLWFIKQAQ